MNFNFSTLGARLMNYIPNVFRALFLLLIAWLVAMLVQKLVEKLLLKTNMDKHLSRGTTPPDPALGKKRVGSISKLLYFFVFILFLPSILDALDMNSVSVPIANMMNGFLGFIPRLIGAAVILFIGYFIAKILRDLTKTLLNTINLDKYFSKITPYTGPTKELDRASIGDVLSKIVFGLVLIPVITVALETLNIKSLTEPIVLILNKVLLMIPNVIVAIILLLIGYYIAKFVGQVLESLLNSMGVQSVFNWADEKTDSTIPRFNLSKIVANLVKFLIMLFITVEALRVLNLEVLNTIGYAVIGYVPLVLSGLVIIGAGVFAGYFVEGMIKKYANSPFTAIIAKYIIIIFAIFMTLEQIKFASTIVNIAFLLILGGLSVAFALSFGLGGREFAKKQLEKIEDKVEKENKKTPPTDPTPPSSTNTPKPPTDTTPPPVIPLP